MLGTLTTRAIHGLDRILQPVQIRLASDPGAIGGQHFANHRFADAISYLREAVRRDPADALSARRLEASEIYVAAKPQAPWSGTAEDPLLHSVLSGHRQSHYARVYELTAERRRTGGYDAVADRIALLQLLLCKYQYSSYLEIGCDRDETFSQITADRKVGVDPKRGGTVRATSNDFFKSNSETFDLIFIDGLHSSEQVLRDSSSALAALNPNGTLVIHDCAPRNEWEARYPKAAGCLLWTGDVWKAFVALRTRPEIDAIVGDFDWGCAVVKVRANSAPLVCSKSPAELSWKDLEQHWEIFLRPKTLEEVLEWLE